MSKTLAFLFGILGTMVGTAQEFITLADTNGLSIAYRWNHPKNKPTELLLRVNNPGPQARDLQAVLDLQVDGFTNEELIVELCIPPGRTLRGKFNGLYFTPEQVTRELVLQGATHVELSTCTVTQLETPCP